MTGIEQKDALNKIEEISSLKNKLSAMEIRYYKKTVYGVDLLYPIDHAGHLQALTGKKTLTDRNITALKGLGFTFKEVLKP